MLNFLYTFTMNRYLIRQKALELYLTGKTLKEITEELGVPLQTVKFWSMKYKWKEIKRDKEKQVMHKLTEEIGNVEVNVKEYYREQIRRANNVINAILEDVVIRDEKGNITGFNVQVKTVNDLVNLLKIKIELAKLDLQLMAGEPVNNELRIKIVKVDGKAIEDGEE